MAAEVAVGGEGALFVGEDKTFVLEVLDASDAPVNVAGWTTQLVVASNDLASTLIFDKAGSVTGTFNAVRASNTQRISAALTDDELNTVKKKTYRYSWKRMNAGVETVLAYGDFIVEKATAP